MVVMLAVRIALLLVKVTMVCALTLLISAFAVAVIAKLSNNWPNCWAISPEILSSMVVWVRLLAWYGVSIPIQYNLGN